MLQTLQNEKTESTKKLSDMAALEAELSKASDEMTRLKDELEKSDSERRDVKKYATELVEKVKKETESLENMVDKRVVNQFLVQFLRKESTRPLKR